MPGRRLLTPLTKDVLDPGQSIWLRLLPRLRPWLAKFAIAVAVVAAGFVVYLAVTYGPAPPTTDVPAPGSAPNLVASGVTGGQPWQITIRRSPSPGRPGQVCWFGRGPAFPPFPSGSCETLQTPPETSGDSAPPGERPNPVQFANLVGPMVQFGLGVVADDVTSIVFRLEGGQRLKLIPVVRDGHRLVAFVIQRQTGIASATVYLNNGQYATTTPTNIDGLSIFPSWLWH